jgi:hypothetical protein
MSYQYPETNYKPVSGPETFNYLVGLSTSQALDILFMSTFNPNFRVVIQEEDGVIKPLPDWEPEHYDPYRIMVSTRKGLNQDNVLDDIIFRVDGIY